MTYRQRVIARWLGAAFWFLVSAACVAWGYETRHDGAGMMWCWFVLAPGHALNGAWLLLAPVRGSAAPERSRP